VTESELQWRKPAALVACLFLLGGIVSQRAILQRQAAYQTISRQFQAQAEQLEKIGVRPPCVMENTSLAYYIGCSAPWTGMGTPEFLASRTTQGLKYWRLLPLPGTLPPIIYLPASAPVFNSAQSLAAVQRAYATFASAG
jgi:hypothetical protein